MLKKARVFVVCWIDWNWRYARGSRSARSLKARREAGSEDNQNKQDECATEYPSKQRNRFALDRGNDRLSSR
jgi:hypothetical protein